MSLIASTVTKACFAWMLFYVLFGASSTGKEFIGDVLSSWMEDKKGGVPLVMLAYPVLIATSVCALLNVQSSRRSCLCPPKPNRWKIGPLRPIFQRVLSNHGDGNFDLYAWMFLLVPFLIYTSFGIHRHMAHLNVNLPMLLLGLQTVDENSASKVSKEIGNAFGMTAIVAMAFFLVPTSKYGPIMKLFGWSHAMAIRLHIWCGRAIVVASLLHGLFHTLRWKYQLGEDVQAFLFPPRQCWAREENFAPTCKNPDTDCTCYDHFVYFTGTLTVLLLIVIFITSSSWVRRKCYNVFLTCHLLVGPLFCFGVIFHYHSAILYMAPSLLYYLATTLPSYLERRRNVGVRVVAVDMIGETPNKHVSLTFEATRETVQAFRPGMYTKLSVPSISNVSHPFTINRVPGQNDQLRVIFRVTGTFTAHLAVLLEAESGIPTIHLDGLHGFPSRMHKLRLHDMNVLVAGGVGVTPFLSLIGDAVASNGKDGRIHPYHNGSRMHSLALHWMCRDSSFIEYVRREYLDPLKGRSTPTCDTQIQIHHTGPAASSDDEVAIRRLVFPSDTVQVTEPFRISRFAPSTRVFSNVGPFLALVIIMWPGLAIIWHCYTNFQEKHEIRGRVFAPVFLLLYISAASYLLARVLSYQWFGKSSTEDEDFKIREDSDHSYEEKLPLSRSPSAGHLGQTMDDEETPHSVTMQCSEGGRPDLEILLESIDDARWPAVFSCGPAAMSKDLQMIVNDKSKARSAVEPSRSSPLVTIYDEVFLM